LLAATGRVIGVAELIAFTDLIIRQQQQQQQPWRSIRLDDLQSSRRAINNRPNALSDNVFRPPTYKRY